MIGASAREIAGSFARTSYRASRVLVVVHSLALWRACLIIVSSSSGLSAGTSGPSTMDASTSYARTYMYTQLWSRVRVTRRKEA